METWGPLFYLPCFYGRSVPEYFAVRGRPLRLPDCPGCQGFNLGYASVFLTVCSASYAVRTRRNPTERKKINDRNRRHQIIVTKSARMPSSCKGPWGMRALLIALMLSLASPANAAEVYVSTRIFSPGIHINIDGRIYPGDEKKFEAVLERYAKSYLDAWKDWFACGFSAGDKGKCKAEPPPPPVYIHATGPGGSVAAALEIADTVHILKLTTWLAAGEECESACTFIWLAGKHSVIQRTARLCFHQAYDPTTNRTDPELNAFLADKFVWYGLTQQQAIGLVNAAPPEGARCMNLIWGLLLGFQPQVVFAIGALSACQAKFCQALP
jgi:Clp protease